MNRYDWLLWAFRLVVSGDAINRARALVNRLEDEDIKGASKREIVENELIPMVKNGGIYVVRALIELTLGSVRNSK